MRTWYGSWPRSSSGGNLPRPRGKVKVYRRSPQWKWSLVAEAIDMFLYNVRSYPESANAHDSLAEAYEATGRTKLALDSCRTACRLAEQFSDSRLPTFRKHLESVEAKLAKEERDGV